MPVTPPFGCAQGRLFGAYRTAPDAALTELGYTGHHENRSLGLTYMNARYYIPGISKFASADTLVPDPGNPQAFNRYTFTLNRPVVFIDPSGHCASDPFDEYHDYECWEVANELSETTGISLNILGGYDWTSLDNAQYADQITEIWYTFVAIMRGRLDAQFGVDTIRFAPPGSTEPSTEAELLSMMSVGSKVVEQVKANLRFDSDKSLLCTCNDLVGFYLSNPDISRDIADNSQYFEEFHHSTSANDETIVALFTNLAGAEGIPYHSAIVAALQEGQPTNPILVQADGNIRSSGIFFTTVESNRYYDVPGINHVLFLYPKGS